MITRKADYISYTLRCSPRPCDFYACAVGPELISRTRFPCENLATSIIYCDQDFLAGFLTYKTASIWTFYRVESHGRCKRKSYCLHRRARKLQTLETSASLSKESFRANERLSPKKVRLLCAWGKLKSLLVCTSSLNKVVRGLVMSSLCIER